MTERVVQLRSARRTNTEEDVGWKRGLEPCEDRLPISTIQRHLDGVASHRCQLHTSRHCRLYRRPFDAQNRQRARPPQPIHRGRQCRSRLCSSRKPRASQHGSISSCMRAVRLQLGEPSFGSCEPPLGVVQLRRRHS